MLWNKDPELFLFHAIHHSKQIPGLIQNMTARCCELPYPEQACCGEEEVSVRKKARKRGCSSFQYLKPVHRSQAEWNRSFLRVLEVSLPKNLLSPPWASSFWHFQMYTSVSDKESLCGREACRLWASDQRAPTPNL